MSLKQRKEKSRVRKIVTLLLWGHYNPLEYIVFVVIVIVLVIKHDIYDNYENMCKTTHHKRMKRKYIVPLKA